MKGREAGRVRRLRTLRNHPVLAGPPPRPPAPARWNRDEYRHAPKPRSPNRPSAYQAGDELKKGNARLSNENFTSRASAEIVQEHRDRQAQEKARVEELGRMIENLGGG